MKNGNLHKSGILKVLLGLAVAGALLFASCQGVFDAAQQTEEKGGYVIVDLGEAARTIRPEFDNNLGANPYQFQYFEYKFTGVGDTLGIDPIWQENSTTNRSDPFYLPKGTYELEVNAYTNTYVDSTNASLGYRIAASGKYGSTITVTGGVTITVSVALAANNVTTQNGSLSISIELGGTATPVFTLSQYMGGELTPVTGFSTSSLTYSSGAWITSAAISLVPGSYLFSARINTTDAKYGGFSEAVHIVSNMQTRIIRSAATNNPVDLVQVSTPDDAIAILVKEIKTWVAGPVNATTGRSVLAYGDPINDAATTTITLNYLGKELANPLSNANATVFPLTLQGGWSLDAGGTTFNVTNATLPTPFNLKNTSVPDGANDTTYKLILQPVAEYKVSYWEGAEEPGRGITEFKDGTGAAVTLSDNNKGYGIGQLGSTSVKVTNAAITRNKADAALSATDNTHTFTAASEAYEIVIYEKADDQVDKAFTTLLSGIAPNRGPTTDDPRVPWVVKPAALSRDRWIEELPAAQVSSGSYKGIVLYYVYSRLNTTATPNNLFDITFPYGDSRWNKVSTDWDVTQTRLLTTSTTDTKKIGFKPWGGDQKVFDVQLKPVAEFEIDFDPNRTGTDQNSTIAIPSGSILIKAGDSQEVTISATDKSGKRFALGAVNTTVKVTNVAIMIDDDVADTFTNAYKLVGSPQQRPPLTPTGGGSPPALTNATDIVQDGADYTINSPTLGAALSTPVPTLLGTTSRVYKIRVYPPITTQEGAAQALLKALSTRADTIPWISGGETANRKLAIPLTNLNVSSGLPVSYLVYVGSSEATIALPSTGWSNTGGYGWLATNDPGLPAVTPPATAANFVKEAKIRFKSYGGEDNDIYIFRVHAAAYYSLSFKREPIGLDDAKGTVTVAGNYPWLPTASVTNTHVNSSTVNGNVTSELIGLGSNITVTSTQGTNVFGYDNLYLTGGSAGTTNAVGPVTINALASQTYSIDVYPSIAEQKASVVKGLQAIDNINGWGAGLSTVDVVPILTPANSNASNVRVVTSTTTPSATFAFASASITVPTGFLNSGYTFQNAGASVVANYAAATGTRDDTITFRPLGGAAGGGDDQTYKFNMTQVAKYTVNFKKGPDASRSERGTILITTFEEGKNTLTTSPLQIDQTKFPNYIIGGVSNASLNTVIRSTVADKNVFNVDSGTFVNGALYDPTDTTTTPTPGVSTITSVSSKEYIINVYPSVDEQKDQVVGLIKNAPPNNLTGNSGWFTLANNSTTELRGPIVPQANGISSTIQYVLGTTSGGAVAGIPTVKVPTNFLSEEYRTGTYILEPKASGVPSSGAVPFTFYPRGLSAAVDPIYTFNVTPIVKYNVVYSGVGVQAAVTISPTAKTSDPSVIYASSDTKTTYGLASATTISVQSDLGTYTKVVITNNQDSQQITLTPNNPSTSSFNPSAGGTYTITVVRDTTQQP